MSNWKEGVDWVADPTGNTTLPNHAFHWGQAPDGGTGGKDDPFNDLQAAIQATSAGGTTITQGRHQGELKGFNKLIKGENVAVLDGFGLSNIGEINKNTLISLQNLTVRNYANIYVFAGGNPEVIYTNVVFIGCHFSIMGSLSIKATNCWFVDCTFNFSYARGSFNNSSFYNCGFINSPFGSGVSIILSCYFDSTSACTLSTSSSRTGRFDYNFFEPETNITINGSVHENLIEQQALDPSHNPNSRAGDARFNNLAAFDFSIASGSPLLGRGLNGTNIANVKEGVSMVQGIAEFDQTVSANPNVAVDSLGQLRVVDSGPPFVRLEFPVEVTEGQLPNRQGPVVLAGFTDLKTSVFDSNLLLINPNPLTLEMRFALVGEDIAAQPWKPYRWNERPTVNGDGTTNGEAGYLWSDNREVLFTQRQVAIKVWKNGAYNA